MADSSTDATNAAKEAALIQTGAAQFVSDAGKYYENKARHIVDIIGIAPIVAPILFLHRTIKDKEINFRIGNEQIHIHPDSVKVEIPI